MIIGLTGTNGAGKTVTADYLQTKGLHFHSLSDEVREELRDFLFSQKAEQAYDELIGRLSREIFVDVRTGMVPQE